MARATREIREEIESWIKNEMTPAQQFRDFENRLDQLSNRALTELARRNEATVMEAFKQGYTLPEYMNHYILRVKFEIKDRKEKKTWTPEK